MALKWPLCLMMVGSYGFRPRWKEKSGQRRPSDSYPLHTQIERLPQTAPPDAAGPDPRRSRPWRRFCPSRSSERPRGPCRTALNRFRIPLNSSGESAPSWFVSSSRKSVSSRPGAPGPRGPRRGCMFRSPGKSFWPSPGLPA
jgi:hypothetical protein